MVVHPDREAASRQLLGKAKHLVPVISLATLEFVAQRVQQRSFEQTRMKVVEAHAFTPTSASATQIDTPRPSWMGAVLP